MLTRPKARVAVRTIFAVWLLAPVALYAQLLTGGAGDTGQYFGYAKGSGTGSSTDGPNLFQTGLRTPRDDHETWDSRFVSDLAWEQKMIDRPVTGPVKIGDGIVVGFAGRSLKSYAFADGSTRWTIEVPGDLTGALLPTGNGDVILVTLQGDALRVKAGDGSQVFRAHVAQEIRTEPALTKDLIVIASKDDLVFALDARTGAVRWRAATGGKGLTAPAVTPEGADADLALLADDAGVVMALALADGKERWRFETHSSILASPVASEDSAYVVGSDRRIHALKLGNGHRRWHRELGAPATTPPALAGDCVIVASLDNVLSAIKRSNGFRKWKAKLPRRVVAPMTVHEHVIYVTPFASRQVIGYLVKNGYNLGKAEIEETTDYGVGRAWTSGNHILIATYGRTLDLYKRITSLEVELGLEKLPAKLLQQAGTALPGGPGATTGTGAGAAMAPGGASK